MTPAFFLCFSFFFSFFSFSFFFGLLAWGWDKAASCSWTAFSWATKEKKLNMEIKVFTVDSKISTFFYTSSICGDRSLSQPVLGKTSFLRTCWQKSVYLLTCSWSSASLWALSSSESSVEDSDSDEESLELSEDEAVPMSGCVLTGTGWSTGAGAGASISSGSSGILAKRISNTSYRKRKPFDEVLMI